MNSKHLACGAVALLILLFVQATLWVQKSSAKMQQQATNASDAKDTALTTLERERAQFAELRRQSADLIAFLKTWQPYFQAIESPQSAEVNFSMRAKDSNLVNLSQRFEQVGVKGNGSVPMSLRAFLIFEDDYVRLLNWLGQIELTMPTVRISRIHLTKGSRVNDLRMELVLDQPLIKK